METKEIHSIFTNELIENQIFQERCVTFNFQFIVVQQVARLLRCHRVRRIGRSPSWVEGLGRTRPSYGIRFPRQCFLLDILGQVQQIQKRRQMPQNDAHVASALLPPRTPGARWKDAAVELNDEYDPEKR